MDELIETEVKSVEEAKSIFTILNVPDKTGISGFSFSRRLVEKTGLKPEDMMMICKEGTPFPYAEFATQLATDGAGSATIGTNSITIKVASDHPNSGSMATYIWMYFGRDRRMKLEPANGFFLGGHTITWDLSLNGDWLEDYVQADAWDEIGLLTDSTDGIKIERICIVHSGQTILNWACNLWLDANKDEPYGRLVLTAEILKHKLSQVGDLWVPQIHWAAREIGKTDGTKYSALPADAWCSEFASWCLRKGLMNTPFVAGGWDSQKMEDYFKSRGRMYTHDEILDGKYQLNAGDYLRYELAGGNHHSGIFIEYIDDPNNPTEDTRIRAIEGNADSTVHPTSPRLRDVASVGNCR